MKCDSCGVMCLIAVAHPALYLDESSSSEYKFPAEVLEFDLRGRVEIPSDGQSAYIDIGEVKSDLSYREAVPQLGLRLGVLRWLTTKCFKLTQESDVRLVGRIFVSKSRSTDSTVTRETDRAQVQEAAEKWGYSLFVHEY